MPVRYLLDEHVSPRVADGLRRAGVDAVAAVAAGMGGLDDGALLEAAVAAGRVVVTYNVADFALLVAAKAAAGAAIPGVVFVSAKSLPLQDIGGLSGALAALAAMAERGEVDVTGGVFLERREGR